MTRLLLAAACLLTVACTQEHASPSTELGHADPHPRISRATLTTTRIPLRPRAQPATLLYDDGVLWVGGSSVLKMSFAEGGHVIERLPSGVSRVALARGGDLLWATGGGDGGAPDGTVVAYDADSREMVQRHVLEGRSPYGIDVGGKGLFVALFQGRLLRFTPHGISNVPLRPGLTQVLVAHGKVWVSNPQRGKVWRVVFHGSDDTNAAATDLRGYPKRTCPQGLESTRDAMWIADPCAKKVWLLDPRSGEVIDAIEGLGRPVDIDIHTGRAWIVSFSDSVVTVLDVTTHDVLAQAKAGARAVAVEAHGREAWVANHEDYSLTHLELR